MLDEIMVKFEKEIALKEDWGDDSVINAFTDFMFEKYEEYQKTIDNSEKLWDNNNVKEKRY